MKQKCSACGNNPTIHIMAKIDSTVSVWVEPMNKIVLDGFLGKIIKDLLDFSAPYYIELFKFVGIVRMNSDVEKALTNRSKVIWREANKRGIKMEQIVVLGKPIEIYSAQVAGKKLIFQSIPNKPCNNGNDRWIDDKSILKKFLKKHNIPTPGGASAQTITEALQIFNKIKKPVIVKPRLGSRGRHTTTKIFTEAQLKQAFKSAKELCSYVIVEEELIGSVYRGTVVNGKLVGVLKGTQPFVTGNGTNTIAELIKEKNATKHEKVKDVEINEKLTSFLERQNLKLSSILKPNEQIILSEKIGVGYGGTSVELWPNVHPKLVAYLEKAGQLIDYSVMGFDFIMEDPKKDPDAQSFGIIECNSLPFIDLHYDPLEGPTIPVAEYVWDMWEKA